METLLNVGWLALALWAFARWLGDRAARPAARPFRLQLFALACVLALLFPVISADDDLLQQFLGETSSSQTVVDGAAAKKACSAHTVFALPPAPLLLSAARGWELLHDFSPGPLRTVSACAPGDRSPPLLS